MVGALKKFREITSWTRAYIMGITRIATVLPKNELMESRLRTILSANAGGPVFEDAASDLFDMT
jgi:hypothetical protein